MNNIKKYFKDNLLLIIFVIVLSVLTFIKLPYTIYSPGKTINVSNRLSIKSDSNINMTSVTAREGNLLNLGLAYLLKDWDIVKNEDYILDNETLEDYQNRSIINYKSAISNATYVSYMKEYNDININTKDYYVEYIFNDANTDLRIGDRIIEVDNLTNMDELNNYISSKNVGDKINIKVLRNNKEKDVKATLIDVDGEAKIGIIINIIYTYPDDVVTYSYKKNESGSSGGLMLTLAIYNSISDNDITGGKKICGTGTIDLEGNVGEIDGVKYKVIGAHKNKCDVFIAPTNNYDEAKKIIENKKYDLKIIEGISFNQVLDELNNI